MFSTTPAKIGLSVALLLAAGGIYYFWAREKPPLPDGIRFVCVETGEYFTFSRNNLPPAYPVPNPKTKKATLLPVYTDEQDGKIYVSARAASVLDQLKQENKHVDPRTRVVTP
jgi:hypothetical protein